MQFENKYSQIKDFGFETANKGAQTVCCPIELIETNKKGCLM